MQNSRVLVEKNFEELSMLMSLIPRIDQISKKNESLSLVSIKVLKLLWWILCSKKSVTLLKDEKQKFEEFLPHDVFVRSDKIRELLHHRLHGHVPHYVFKVIMVNYFELTNDYLETFWVLRWKEIGQTMINFLEKSKKMEVFWHFMEHRLKICTAFLDAVWN